MNYLLNNLKTKAGKTKKTLNGFARDFIELIFYIAVAIICFYFKITKFGILTLLFVFIKVFRIFVLHPYDFMDEPEHQDIISYEDEDEDDDEY